MAGQCEYHTVRHFFATEPTSGFDQVDENQERHAPRPSYGDAAEDIIFYAVSAQAMRERLDAMGFMVAHPSEDYRRVQAEDYELYLSPRYTVRDRKKIKDWTYGRLAEAIARLVPQGFQISKGEKFAADRVAERLVKHVGFGFDAYFSDPRLSGRTIQAL